MPEGYFQRAAQSGTRVWVNNPAGAEIGPAVVAGAFGATTNPTYCTFLLGREPEFIDPLIDQALRETPDDAAAAERVYQQVVLRNRDAFLPLYLSSGGTAGFAIIQGDPRHDADPAYIVAEALRHHALGENIMVKLPANVAGAAAIQELVPHDVPICVTEVMGVPQAVYIWEAYRRASRQSGRRPPFVVAFIAAPLDRYLAAHVQRENVAIAPEVLAQASFAVAREGYRVFQERGYDGVMLIGGATAPPYFSELVGGKMHVTMNWAEIEALLRADGPVVSRLFAPTPPAVLAEMCEKLPDFRRSYYADALSPAEYGDYGPLTFFRGMFVQAYNQFLAELARRRAAARP